MRVLLHRRKRILYASTHLGGDSCPPPPDISQGYVWAIFPDYDIFTANADGCGLKPPDHDDPGYDAEATISTDGKHVVFTSTRDGDLELYTMHADGNDVNGSRTRSATTGARTFRMTASRSSAAPTTRRSKANESSRTSSPARWSSRRRWTPRHGCQRDRRRRSRQRRSDCAPYFSGAGRTGSSYARTRPSARPELRPLPRQCGRNGLERVTFNPRFDGFPMFSPDGKRLAFCSNRHDAKAGETNVFVADWVR